MARLPSLTPNQVRDPRHPLVPFVGGHAPFWIGLIKAEVLNHAGCPIHVVPQQIVHSGNTRMGNHIAVAGVQGFTTLGAELFGHLVIGGPGFLGYVMERVVIPRLTTLGAVDVHLQHPSLPPEHEHGSSFRAVAGIRTQLVCNRGYSPTPCQ